MYDNLLILTAFLWQSTRWPNWNGLLIVQLIQSPTAEELKEKQIWYHRVCSSVGVGGDEEAIIVSPQPTLSQFALSLADLSNSQWQIMNALEVCRMQLHKTRSINPVVTPFHKGYRRGVRLFMNLSKDPYPQMESLLTDLTFWDSAHPSSESEWSPWSVDLQGLGDVEELLLQGPERGTVVRVRCPADPHCLKKWMDERNY